jgi:hypothetical protein
MLSCVRRDAAASRPKIFDWFLNFSPPSSLSERAGGKIPLFGDRRINHGCVPNRHRQDYWHAGSWRRALAEAVVLGWPAAQSRYEETLPGHQPFSIIREQIRLAILVDLQTG